MTVSRYMRAPLARQLRHAVAVCLFSVAVIACPLLAKAAPDSSLDDFESFLTQRNVLIVHSAHKGYGWTDAVMRGIADTLDAAALETEVWIEYLDRRRARDQSYLNEEVNLLRKKLGNQQFEAVVATGNEAFEFLLEHRAELFPGVPLAFCGVNGLHPEAFADSRDITGVIERNEFAATIELALGLHPNAREVVIIAPDSANMRFVENLSGRVGSSTRVRYIREMHLFDIEAQLSGLDENSILLPIGEPLTADGRFLPLDRFVRRLSAIGGAPVYAVWGFALGEGIVGGKLADGYRQGRQAAQMVLSVLREGTIPPLVIAESHYGFDHIVLERFAIDEAVLPAGSVVINQPQSFYRLHWKLIWGVLGAFAAMAAFIGLLVRTNILRTRAEATLKERERLFRDTTEVASDWIWETDEQLRFSYLSERFPVLTGIPADQVLGRRRWDVSAETADARKWREHRETLEAHRSFRDFVYRTRSLGPQGEERYFKINGKPVNDAQGRFQGYRGTGTDVTEQVRAESSLRESQRMLATLMGNLPGMAYRCRGDPEWTPEFLSSGSARLTGYTPEEFYGIQGLSYTGLIDAEDRYGVWREVQDAVAAHRHYQVSYRIRTASGEKKWVWEQGCGVYSETGELQSYEGFITDITDRKRTERELRRMRAFLINIIDSMPSVLIGVDGAGQVTQWNRGAEQATGISRLNAMGEPFVQVCPSLSTQSERVQKAIRRREALQAERIARDDEHGGGYVDVMVYPLMDDEEGAVIRVDDVSDRVRMEQMIVQTEKMLSIGGLAAGMAHEINNPLSAILQGTQNVLRRLSPDLSANLKVADEFNLDLDAVDAYLRQRGVRGFLEGIHESGTRASRIVGDMLEFSRRGGTELAQVRVDEMIDTVLRLVANAGYDFERVEIRREFDPALQDIPCDRTEIEQVLLNLIMNAVHAMLHDSEPPYRLILRTRRDGDEARIEIEDNGPGMDEETRRSVFEPFFTTKLPGEGTGLGLSVSYFIVTEQHRGRLSVESMPGRGARFVMRLPIQGRKAA